MVVKGSSEEALEPKNRTNVVLKVVVASTRKRGINADFVDSKNVLELE